METTIVLMCLFAICCIWCWYPNIKMTYYYCKSEIEDFVKYIRFKLKNRNCE